MTNKIKVPGGELEKAAAGEVTRACRTLTDTVGGLFERWTIKGNTEAKVEAAERAKDIEQERAVRRGKELASARREAELDEVKHADRLARAGGRLTAEWQRDQKNVESVAALGIELANNDPDGDSERVLDGDWLLRFFQYAASVDDDQLRAVMARVLADASISSRPLTSRRAIDTIRFFEASSYNSFQFVARELAIFKEVPSAYLRMKHENSPPDFDMSELIELGLIKLEHAKSLLLSVGGLDLHFAFAQRQTFTFELVKLTQTGREIAALLYSDVRSRFPRGTSTIDYELIWTIQKNLELNRRQVKSVAAAIVQEASSFWDFSYSVTLHRPSVKSETIFRGVRDDIMKPFGIPDLDLSRYDIDPLLLDFSQVIVEEFRYFDEMQLPNMIHDPM